MLIAFKLRLGPDDPVVTLDVESPGFERWLQLLQKWIDGEQIFHSSRGFLG